MHYDYKNIYTIEDLYLLSEGNSSLLSSFQNQSLDFPKKSEISSYLIMQKIARRDRKTKCQALLQKFKSNKISTHSLKFTEDKQTPSIIKNDQFLTIQDENREKNKNKKKKTQKFTFKEEHQSISEPEPFKIEQNLQKHNSQKLKFEKQEKKQKKKKKTSILDNKEFNKTEKVEQSSPKASKMTKTLIKKIHRHPFQLKNPRNRKALNQDFNDYYDHYSDDDKDEATFSFSEEEEEEVEVEEDQLEEDQNNKTPHTDNINAGSDSEEESGDDETDSDENLLEEEVEGVVPSIRKEVSFHPSEKNSDKLLSPKKSRSIGRSKTINRSGTSIGGKEDGKQVHVNDEENEKNDNERKKSGGNSIRSSIRSNSNVNPYIGVIEKLLKSQDIFNEDIEGMMGISHKTDLTKEMEIDLNFLGESERNIYKKIVDWNGYIEKLLKKDEKEIKRYEKKMQGIFHAMYEAEKGIEAEQDGDEDEEGDDDN